MSRSFNKISSFIKSRRRIDSDRIFVTREGTSSIDDGYNRIKDNLLCRSEEGAKVIQIESSVSGEGKASLTANLAVSLSFNGKRVAVVDLDFRNPKLSKILEVEEENGIGDYVVGQVGLDRIIKTSKHGVDVITRGKEIYNSSFVLNSEKMKALISALKKDYDFVLISGAPISQTSDYMHVAKISDGIILAVSSGFTKKSVARESVALLSKLSVPLIGCVMTQIAPDLGN